MGDRLTGEPAHRYCGSMHPSPWITAAIFLDSFAVEG